MGVTPAGLEMALNDCALYTLLLVRMAGGKQVSESKCLSFYTHVAIKLK